MGCAVGFCRENAGTVPKEARKSIPGLRWAMTADNVDDVELDVMSRQGVTPWNISPGT